MGTDRYDHVTAHMTDHVIEVLKYILRISYGVYTYDQIRKALIDFKQRTSGASILYGVLDYKYLGTYAVCAATGAL